VKIIFIKRCKLAVGNESKDLHVQIKTRRKNMNYWLYVLRKENYEVSSLKKFSVIGLAKRNLNTAKKINIGDRIIIYIASRISKFAGIIEVISDYYENNDIVWDGIFPIRLRTKPYLILDNNKFIDVHGLVDKLSFIRNKTIWRNYFRHTIIKIEFKDYKLVEHHLKKQKNPK